MNIKKIFFETEDGVELCGLLHEHEKNNNEEKTDEIVIAVHGMQSNCMKRRDDILANNITNEGISYFCFNNRGHDLVNSITKKQNEKAKKELCGSSLENIEESYYDIKSAIETMAKLGYTKIHLQGHSLGCTKIVYTYTKMKEQNEDEILNKIKSIILLSMVDTPNAVKFFFQDDMKKLTEFMENEKKQGRGEYAISLPEAMLPMSPNTFLKFIKDNNKIDFARYSDESFEFKELNNISIPLFMRWGNNKELIMQNAEDLVMLLKNKIKNDKLDINYIDGAGHNYRNKEEELANQIISFIENI